MRRALLDPISDKKRLALAEAQASELYRLHEAGKNYASQLRDFAELVGKPVTKHDVDAAFGSIDPESFAQGVLANYDGVPTDLTDEEMVELFENLCTAKGTELQQSYWLRCLELNTGDDQVSDLIFWPDIYFGDGNLAREMPAKEMLQTALATGKKKKSEK